LFALPTIILLHSPIFSLSESIPSYRLKTILPVQVWGPLAKFAATRKAGTPIIVEGKIKPETYTADGVEYKTFSIKADDIRKIEYSAPNEASESKAAKPAKKKAK
jgi:single-stranded DNA-binding protein